MLIRCSTRAGAFGEEVVGCMTEGCERSIVLPLSNPKDVVEWTRGKDLVATRSPFPPVKLPNGKP